MRTRRAWWGDQLTQGIHDPGDQAVDRLKYAQVAGTGPDQHAAHRLDAGERGHGPVRCGRGARARPPNVPDAPCRRSPPGARRCAPAQRKNETSPSAPRRTPRRVRSVSTRPRPAARRRRRGRGRLGNCGSTFVVACNVDLAMARVMSPHTTSSASRCCRTRAVGPRPSRRPPRRLRRRAWRPGRPARRARPVRPRPRPSRRGRRAPARDPLGDRREDSAGARSMCRPVPARGRRAWRTGWCSSVPVSPVSSSSWMPARPQRCAGIAVGLVHPGVCTRPARARVDAQSPSSVSW
jgi:hypothetical protein